MIRGDRAADQLNGGSRTLNQALDIGFLRTGNGAVVHLRGELDVGAAPRLRDALTSLVSDGVRSLVVDLGDVTFVDAGGLGVLVQASKLMSVHSGSMAVTRPSDDVLKIFELTGLREFFDMHDTVDEAAPSST